MITAHPTPLHLVGDEDSSKRRQILDGARKVFMDLGFDGASMGEIARSAGVSKGTLYVYFADKNRLFEAIVERKCSTSKKWLSISTPNAMSPPRFGSSVRPISNCCAGRVADRRSG